VNLKFLKKIKSIHQRISSSHYKELSKIGKNTEQFVFQCPVA